MQQQLEKEFLRALPSLRTLPGHVEGIATQLRGGRLSMRTERYAGDDRAVVDAWIDRVTFAAIGIFGLLGSALLLLAAAVLGDAQDDLRQTLQFFGFFGLAVTAVSRCASWRNSSAESPTARPIAGSERSLRRVLQEVGGSRQFRSGAVDQQRRRQPRRDRAGWGVVGRVERVQDRLDERCRAGRSAGSGSRPGRSTASSGPASSSCTRSRRSSRPGAARPCRRRPR